MPPPDFSYSAPSYRPAPAVVPNAASPKIFVDPKIILEEERALRAVGRFPPYISGTGRPMCDLHKAALDRWMAAKDALDAAEAKVKLARAEQLIQEATPKTLRSPVSSVPSPDVRTVAVKVVNEASVTKLGASARPMVDAVEEAPKTLRSIAPSLTTAERAIVPVVTKTSALRRGAQMAGRAAGPVVAVAKVAQTASIVHNAQERAKNAPTTEGAAARGMTEIAGNLAQVSSVPVWVASEIESRYLPKAKPISGALSAGVETVGIVGDALSDTKQAERSTFGLASDLEKGKYGTYMQAVAAFGEKHSAWTADLVGDLAFVFTAGDVSSLRE